MTRKQFMLTMCGLVIAPVVAAKEDGLERAIAAIHELMESQQDVMSIQPTGLLPPDITVNPYLTDSKAWY